MDKTMDEKEEVRAWMTELVGSGLEEEDVSMVMDVEQAEVLLDRHWETSMEVGWLVKCSIYCVVCHLYYYIYSMLCHCPFSPR